MRHRVFAALLATTFLTPNPVAAEPVSALIAGFQAIAGGTIAGFGAAGITGSVLGYTGLSAFAFNAGAAFAVASGSFLGRAVLSIGLSALAQSFAPVPSLPKPSAIMGNFAQPISYAEYVFGRTRTGGPLGFTGAQSSRRYYTVILAAHECEGVVEHWLDEFTAGVDLAITDVDLPNILTSADSGAYSVPDKVEGKGRIDFFTGAAGQTAHAGLVSEFTEITTAHDFAGLCGATLWARKVSGENFPKVYPGGRQWVYTSVLDGWNQIFDPRDDSTGYTNNAALCMAKWLTAVLGQSVDWDEVATEAAICDQTVTDADGISIPRWTVGGKLSDDQPFDVQRAQMAGACDAFLYERPDGKVGFKVGRWIAPTVTLTASDFASLELTQGQWGSDAPTEIAPIYTEPDNAWRETAAGVWVEDATSRRVRDEPQLFMVTNHNQVSRLAKRIAKARRPEWTLTGTIVGLIGMELIGQRFFTVEHEGLGETITFEVGLLRRTGPITFEIQAVSSVASDFDFVASTEEPTRPSILSVVSDLSSPDISGVSATANDGASITVSWDVQADYLWQQVRWREDGETGWQSATVSEVLRTQHIITGLSDGTTYQIQVRNVSAGLLTNGSDWLPVTPLEVDAVANSTAPAALAAFSVSGAGSDVTVSLTAPNDPNYAGARIWRGTDSVLANAALIQTEYGAANAVDSYLDAGLAADDYWYWAASINSSGVEGSTSGPQTATTT